MCGFSPLEFALVSLLVGVIAGPRLLAFRRRRPAARRPKPVGPRRPEPWRVVLGLGTALLVVLLALRFGSRVMPFVARVIRGSTW